MLPLSYLQGGGGSGEITAVKTYNNTAVLIDVEKELPRRSLDTHAIV